MQCSLNKTCFLFFSFCLHSING